MKRPWTYLVFKSVYIEIQWKRKTRNCKKKIFVGFFSLLGSFEITLSHFFSLLLFLRMPSFSRILYSIIHFNDYAFRCPSLASSFNWKVTTMMMMTRMIASSHSLLRIHAFVHNSTAGDTSLYNLDMFLEGVAFDFFFRTNVSLVDEHRFHFVWILRWYD